MEAEQTDPGLGHNQPPSLLEELREKRSDIFGRLDELKDACQNAPGSITSEENAKKASDLLKQVQKAIKAANEARMVEQAPWQKRVDETRAAFNVPIEELKKARGPVKEAHDAYLQRKKDEEKRKREEEARKAREEAERQAAIAAEEERKRKEAEERERQAQEAARQAQIEREKAQEEARTARAEADKLRQEAAEAEAERLRQERKRKEDEARRAADERKEAEREEKANFDQALRSEQRADKQEMAAQGKLERVRSDHGAVSSLVKRKVAQITDEDKLPKGILWPFISADAKRTAVNKAVETGLTERDLPGVRIVEIEEGRTV